MGQYSLCFWHGAAICEHHLAYCGILSAVQGHTAGREYFQGNQAGCSGTYTHTDYLARQDRAAQQIYGVGAGGDGFAYMGTGRVSCVDYCCDYCRCGFVLYPKGA